MNNYLKTAMVSLFFIFFVSSAYSAPVNPALNAACDGVSKKKKGGSYDKTIDGKAYSCQKYTQTLCKNGGSGAIAGTSTTTECTEKTSSKVNPTNPLNIKNSSGVLLAPATQSSGPILDKPTKLSLPPIHPSLPPLNSSKRPQKSKLLPRVKKYIGETEKNLSSGKANSDKGTSKSRVYNKELKKRSVSSQKFIKKQQGRPVLDADWNEVMIPNGGSRLPHKKKSNP